MIAVDITGRDCRRRLEVDVAGDDRGGCELTACALEQNRLSLLAQKLGSDDTLAELDEADEPPSQKEQLLASKQAVLAEMRTKYTPVHPDIVRLQREVDDLMRQVEEERTLLAQQQVPLVQL